MLENIENLENLVGLARRRSKHFDLKAVHPADKEKFETDGWEFVKILKSSV